MQSFRTEIENPIVEKDILELERKIRLFREGKLTRKNSEASGWHVVSTVSVSRVYR